MVAFLPSRRKLLSLALAAFSAVALAACDAPTNLGGGPSINPGGTVPVALLVPQSSESAAGIATSLENAARLAVNDLVSVQIDLRVYDTAGTAEGATAAAERAIDDGARIFVGPLFAEAAAAAGQVAASRGINVLTFSNNPAVAGGNVFLLGNTFQTSSDRLVRYALSQGITDIYIVNANDTAEETGRDAIFRAAQANGARVAGVGSFDLSQQGIIDAVPGISADYRASGATAVFSTSGTSGALPFLSELLPENGVNAENAQFIGLQRLDIPSSALSLGGLQGAWFAVPSPDLAARFSSRYTSAFGSQPTPVAGLAYDGIAAIGALIAQGNSDALTVDALTQGQGFAGVNGPFRLFRSGTNERGLAVAQIQNNQVIVIDPAPRSFGGFGF